MSEISFADIQSAAVTIKGMAVRTPLLTMPALDERLGGRVFLKAECLQRIGAFKFRGAYNRIARLSEAEKAGGVVACSSGNHAQGVAEAARLVGTRATIVMPEDAPAVKVAGTRAAGAGIVFYDRQTEDREAIAEAICAEQGATFVHPFNDPFVIAGQGTVGLEAGEDLKALGIEPDLALVPASGGGLAAGFCLGLHGVFPACTIWGCEPYGHDDLRASLKAGKPVPAQVPGGSGLCDALLAPMPGETGFPILKEHLAGVLAVEDHAIYQAMAFAFSKLKLVVEPGGVIALAALLDGQIMLEGKTCVVVLSGGNVDFVTLQDAMQV